MSYDNEFAKEIKQNIKKRIKSHFHLWERKRIKAHSLVCSTSRVGGSAEVSG
jgi:hypothetical protein